MRICIIVEGSYPYITGGVSSWVNSLIRNMPENEFVIYAIAPEQKFKGDFKYEIPDNVVEIVEVFLDSWLFEDIIRQKKIKFTPKEQNVLMQLIIGEKFDWEYLFNIIENKKVINVQDFLLSRDFFDIVHKSYTDSFSQSPFTEFFWTMRSMLLPLFHIMKHDIPYADIYHSPSTGYAGIVGTLAKRRYKKPLLITEHGIYTREREIEIVKATWMQSYYKSMWIEFFYNLSRCAYDYADEVLTLFEKNKEVEVSLGCDREKISIIPNGVDYDGFSNLSDVGPIFDDDIPNEPDMYTVSAIVRVVPIKDIKTMLLAFDRVQRVVPNTRFFIMGSTDEDEEYYGQCIQAMNDLKIKNLRFTGKVNVKEYIPASDLFVLSSISEGQPLSVLETMASGKPNVVTDVGSCSELLFGRNDGLGKCGCIVPVMDYVMLSKCIIDLLKNEPLRHEMGRIAMERVNKFYRRETMISSYQEVYDRVYGINQELE